MLLFRLPLVKKEKDGDEFPPESYNIYVNNFDGAVAIAPKYKDEEFYIEYIGVVPELAKWRPPKPGILTEPRIIELGRFGDEFGGMLYRFIVLHYNKIGLEVTLTNPDNYWLGYYGNPEVIELAYPKL